MIVDSRSSPPKPGSGRAIFTVDLEEYFQVDALRKWVPEGEWDSLPERAGWVLDRLLERLDAHGARATFFVSDWILRTRPELARRVVDAGHEAGVLGRPPDEGADDRRRAFRRTALEGRDRLRAITGKTVLGYRGSRLRHPIPSERAAEVLAGLGYAYDSTVADDRQGPEREFSDGGGTDGGSDRPSVPEVPPTACSVGGERLFTAGGTAFRLLPESVVHGLLSRAASPTCGGVFHMRAWEFDPEQPVLPVPPLARARLYWRVEGMEERLDRLLEAFEFDSVAGALGLARRTQPTRVTASATARTTSNASRRRVGAVRSSGRRNRR